MKLKQAGSNTNKHPRTNEARPSAHSLLLSQDPFQPKGLFGNVSHPSRNRHSHRRRPQGGTRHIACSQNNPTHVHIREIYPINAILESRIRIAQSNSTKTNEERKLSKGEASTQNGITKFVSLYSKTSTMNLQSQARTAIAPHPCLQRRQIKRERSKVVRP